MFYKNFVLINQLCYKCFFNPLFLQYYLILGDSALSYEIGLFGSHINLNIVHIISERHLFLNRLWTCNSQNYIELKPQSSNLVVSSLN
jgi:hypothetical protein